MNEFRWEDLALGLKAGFQTTISQSMLDSFRRLSGDVNPLHSDASFARERGFDDIVVHGFLVASTYSQLVGVHLPGKFCLLHDIHIWFSAPVYVSDRLDVSGEIVHLTEAYRQIEVAAQILRSSTLVSKAKIRVGVRE
jgi:3-hydroxybutyryl-CoA dehydratase